MERFLGMTLLLLTSFITSALFIGCDAKKEDEDSSVKFVATAQDKRNHAYYDDDFTYINKQAKYFLIYKVHSGFNYSLSIEGNCVTEADLEPAITKALTSWQVPLADAHAAGNLKLHENWPITHRATKVDADADIAFIFKCEQGRSHLSPKYDEIATITMYQAQYIRHNLDYVDRFQMSVLLHEVGHAFGLGDTYVYDEGVTWAQTEEVKVHNQSTDENTRTYGSQALSIMNSTHLFNTLQPDDEAGIIWLYQYYVTQEISELTGCPHGYAPEEATGGCVISDQLGTQVSDVKEVEATPDKTGDTQETGETVVATSDDIFYQKMVKFIESRHFNNNGLSFYQDRCAFFEGADKNICTSHAFILVIHDEFAESHDLSHLYVQNETHGLYELTPSGRSYAESVVASY